jgi:NADPH-dependent 2,4-dienoyl-CoA reductase/sulfur reductase-like enzyme
MTRLVVVGASLAGLRAVQAARQDGFEGTITLVGAEDHLPYDRPPLSKAYLDAAAAPDVILKQERHLRDDLGVDLRLGAPATRLDPAAREVSVADVPVPYDALVIATGARARTISGTDAIAGVHTLRTLEDAAAVRTALDAGARTVVIGAGFIGSEVASAARKRGLPVTVVEAAAVPMVPAVGAEVGRLLAELHLREGTDLRCGVTVKHIYRRQGRLRGVRLSDGSVLDADLVVVGIGATPATEWLAGSGLELDDGIVCDETLAARGADGVYAAGDVVRWPNELFGTMMRVEHWSAAAEQGAAAARNAVGPGPPARYVTVPYFWSDWYRHRIQFVGVASPDEVHIVMAGPDRFVALYRQHDRVVGALTLNGQAVVMKYRALIANGASWDEALAFRPTVRQSATVG